MLISKTNLLVMKTTVFVLTCTTDEGELVFNRLFLEREKCVDAMQKEIVSFCDTLMNDGVPEEQIRACLYEKDEKALVSWIEGGRVKTYYYVVDEEELEM